MNYPDIINDSLAHWLETAAACWEETLDDDEAHSLVEDQLKEVLDPREHFVSKIATSLLLESAS